MGQEYVNAILRISRRRNGRRRGFESAEAVAKDHPEELAPIVAELDWAVEFLNRLARGEEMEFKVDEALVKYSADAARVLSQEKVTLPTASQVMARPDFGSLRKGVRAFDLANEWKFLDSFQGADWWAGMAPGMLKIYLQNVYPQIRQEGVFLGSALEEALAIGVLNGQVGDVIVRAIASWFAEEGFTDRLKARLEEYVRKN